jgi:hypothetical protein
MMPLSPMQQREAAQLLLVAQEYLRLAAPPPEARAQVLGGTTDAWTRAALTDPEWRHTVRTAHLASAAVRLAALDELLEETQTGTRNAFSSCRAYFKVHSGTPGPLAAYGARWFHVLLRDAIGHPEPGAEQPDDPQQLARYRERQRHIETTTWDDAVAWLSATTRELSATLKAVAVPVPTLGP